MKIIYFVLGIYNSGGIDRVISLKANYLVQEGNDVLIVTTDQKGRRPFFELDERIKLYDLGLNYDDDFAVNPLLKTYRHFHKNRVYKKKLAELISIEKPDICVSVGGKEIEFIGKMHLQCKTVFEHHFTQNYIRYFRKTLHGKVIGGVIGDILTRRLISNSQSFDKVVVLTKEDKVIWEKTNDNVYQIYNPLPFESKEVSSLDSKNMITVGRLTAQKNYDSLIKAWGMVQSKHPDWTMNVWGDGELKEHLQSLIKECGVQDTFLLCGVTKNIKEEYLKSSVYVMSSIFEGFPMVLLEAASFGLPLISYSCECGPRDIIEDGKNGMLIPVNDEEKLAEAMCRIIEDVELRKEMGRQAKIMSKRFSPDRVLPQWPVFFEGLIKGCII